MKNATAMLLALLAGPAFADSVVSLHLVDEQGIGAEIGKITISESKYGLVLTPALQGLPPGLHGFHVHQNPSCEPGEKDGKRVAALGAGGTSTRPEPTVTASPGGTATWATCRRSTSMPAATPRSRSWRRV